VDEYVGQVVKTSKKCNGPCGRVLPLSEFRRHKGHGDGYDSQCKECTRDADRAKKARVEASLPSTNVRLYNELSKAEQRMVQPYLTLRNHQSFCAGCERDEDLVERASVAYELFFNEFSNPRLGGLPEHAKVWVRAALSNPRLLLNVPPRHAKTTLMAIWFVIWQLACDRNTQVILVSRTISLGEKVSRKLVHELETNVKLIKAFGRFRPRDLTRPWREAKGELEIENKDLSMRSGDLSVQIRGSGQQVLGMEADWVIADDITNRRVANSETERNSEWDYFLGDVLTRLAPEGKVFCIGQRVHSNDIYGRLSRMIDDDGAPAWHTERTPAILDEESGTVLWHAQWPYEKLVEKRKSIGTSLFSCMYQQAPEISGDFIQKWWLEGTGSEDNPGCFDRSRSIGMGWRPDPGQQGFMPVVRAMSVDPSPTRFAGIIVADIIYLPRAQFFNCAIVDILRLEPGHGLRGMVDAIDGVASKYRPQACIFETNSAKWLRDDPAWNRVEPKFQQFVGHNTTRHNKGDDLLGVWSLAADFEAGRIRLPYQTLQDRLTVDLLIDEALAYPNGQTDDVLMALWFIKANYKTLIPREFLPTHFRRQTSAGTWDMARLAAAGAWR
jgi:hypothetical protein